MASLVQLLRSLVAAGGLVTALKLLRFLHWRKQMLVRFKGPVPALLQGDLGLIKKYGGANECFFRDLHSSYGPIARFFIGPRLNISVCEVALQREALAQLLSRPEETKRFLSYLGDDNLLFVKGERHAAKRLRARFSDMLSDEDSLNKLHYRTRESAISAGSSWTGVNSAQNKAKVDVWDDLSSIVYNVVASVVLNLEWADQTWSSRMLTLHNYLIKHADRWALCTIPPIWDKDYRQFQQTSRDFRDLVEYIVLERRRKVSAKPSKFAKDCSALTVLVSHVDDDGLPIVGKHQAVSCIMGLIDGAFRTLRAGVFWTLFLLARNQGSQGQLLSELDTSLGNGVPSRDQLGAMPHLGAVIIESLRLRPPVPVVQRVNHSQEVLIGGRRVPRGTTVVVPLFMALRDKDIFGQDADSFQPERFLKGKLGDERRCQAAAVFGAGSRECPAVPFGYVVLRSMIASILQTHSVHLANPANRGEFVVDAGISLPSAPPPLVFRKRRRNL